jgi:hypothetical protein
MLGNPIKISLLIERRDAEALETLAEEAGVGFSNYVRQILRRHLGSRKTQR